MQSPDLLNLVPVTVHKAWACALLLDTLPVRNHAGMRTDLPVRKKKETTEESDASVPPPMGMA